MKDTIRENTPPAINKRIDEITLEDLDIYRDQPDKIAARLRQLDRTWDVESFVEMAGALLTLAGLGAAVRGSRRWLLLPAAAQGVVFAHSLPAWDPLTPLFRSLGIWSRKEIEREKHALKMLRGDYERVGKDHTPKSALAASQGTVGLKTPTGNSEALPKSRRRGLPRP